MTYKFKFKKKYLIYINLLIVLLWVFGYSGVACDLLISYDIRYFAIIYF